MSNGLRFRPAEVEQARVPLRIRAMTEKREVGCSYRSQAWQGQQCSAVDRRGERTRWSVEHFVVLPAIGRRIGTLQNAPASEFRPVHASSTAGDVQARPSPIAGRHKGQDRPLSWVLANGAIEVSAKHPLEIRQKISHDFWPDFSSGVFRHVAEEMHAILPGKKIP